MEGIPEDSYDMLVVTSLQEIILQQNEITLQRSFILYQWACTRYYLNNILIKL